MKKSKSSGPLLPIIFLLIIIGFGYVIYQWFTIDRELKEMKVKEQQRIESETITLPPDAVKTSGCVAHMGEHWARPSDLPFGPIYTVYKGKVISIEYMFKSTDVPGEVLAKGSPEFAMKYMKDNNLSFGDIFRPHFTFNLNNLKYKFANLEWTQPHAGFLEPHYDLHFFIISKDELEAVCPNATIQDAQNPDIEHELDKYNIPYIPMSSMMPKN
jgi:hypothetical protein